MKIPENLFEKVSTFPESSYGATTVNLVLSNGRKIKNVVLAWGAEIVKVNNHLVAKEGDLNFSISEIIDVELF